MLEEAYSELFLYLCIEMTPILRKQFSLNSTRCKYAKRNSELFDFLTIDLFKIKFINWSTSIKSYASFFPYKRKVNIPKFVSIILTKDITTS